MSAGTVSAALAPVGASTDAKCLLIIPCLNEAAHIEGLLRQMLPQARAHAGHIVVVDGGSIDGTQARVQTIQRGAPGEISLLHNPDRIQSAGINHAVRAFGGSARWMIRIDAHARYPDDYVAQLLAEARAQGAGSVVVSMEAEGEGLLQRVIAETQNAILGNGNSKHRTRARGEFVDHGHHALFDLAVFRALGGYDPDFSHNEDAEYDFRQTQRGHRVWLTRQTGVTYFPRRTLRSLMAQYFNHGRGRAKNLLKHRATPNLRQMAVIAVAPALTLALLAGMAAVAAAAAHLWDAAAPALLWVAALPALLWVAACAFAGLSLAVQRMDPRLVLSPIVAMVMHAAWSFGYWSLALRRGWTRQEAWT